MKIKVIAAIIALFALSCAQSLQIEDLGTHSWESQSTTASAHYYQLSDSSLQFIKLVIPGMGNFTLPRIVSGSGTRYSMDMDIVWWEQGDSAFVETRDENGEWQTAVRLVILR